MLCEIFNVICSVVDGKNNSLKVTMEQFTEKGFHSSREWLATHLQDMIGKEHSGIVIEQVLQTYDSLYHSYVLQVLTTRTHTQKKKAKKKQSLSLPITGHAFLDNPGHLCTGTMCRCYEHSWSPGKELAGGTNHASHCRCGHPVVPPVPLVVQ